jgi:2-succinyl-5-enolpyruvyl-6-hydroxy-3-cyclohexene-1-carboxylate synthase
MLSTARLNADLAATLVAGALDAGVHDVVMSPGSRNTPLTLAFAEAANDEGRLRLHVFTDERTAGFVALGLARATGAPVALLCTSGSAAAHYLPAVIEASEDRVPLVILTADRPAELHGCGASQTVDQQRLFGVHVRHFRDLGSPATAPDLAPVALAVARALSFARGPLPGPVHLNVPFREPLWTPEVVGRPVRSPVALPAAALAPLAAAAALAPLAAALQAAERPLIVAGPLAPDRDLTAADAQHLLVAAARFGCPVLADATSQLRFAGDAGTTSVITSGEALLRAPAVAAFLATAPPDVVVRLGRAPTSRTALTFLAGLPKSTRVLHVDPRGDIHDPAHRAELVVTAPLDALAAALGEAPMSAARTAWAAAWARVEAVAQAALAGVCADGFWAGAIARTVAEHLPTGAALHVASSMPVRDVDAFAPMRSTGHPVYANRGAAGIDGTVATALGLAMGRRGRVVLLCGDLALLHDVGTLIATRGRTEPLTLVVVDNGGGGIFGFLPIAEHPTAFERFFLTPPVVDFAAVAAAAGARFTRVEDVAGLREALVASAHRPTGVDVIACPIDRADDIARHRAAWAAVADALAHESPPDTSSFAVYMRERTHE